MLENLNQNDSTKSHEAVGDAGSLSSMSLNLMQSDFFRQLKQSDSSNSTLKNALPELQIKMDGKENSEISSHKYADSHSPFANGAELITERELKQAGLNPKNVKHEEHSGKNGETSEKTTVKYPDGLSVTVEGKPSSDKSAGQTSAHVDLPQGYSRDSKSDAIYDRSGKIVAKVDGDRVTVKVNGKWLDQTPAGVSEATVIESRDGRAIQHF